MEFLASDALRGRGSGTADELVAATYIASELQQYGIHPAGDDHSYIQAATNSDKTKTWNVIGILPGNTTDGRKSAVVLSAHLDHLGVGKPVNNDDIYNGADDDASGVSAVLEFARWLEHQGRPQRTVLFVFFGSEETGGIGATYFVEHAPLPLNQIALALEFEMIGRPDPAMHGDTVWLTGWPRSNLGSELEAHGANIVADPHTTEDFFARADNYVLAKKGLVAHTISSFGMHKDYHQPSDDLAHIDWRHLDAAVQSFFEPLEWLVNSDFRPEWKPGGRP